MTSEGISSYQAAEERVKENDRVRNTFIETFYHVKWDAADYFDLVLDTVSAAHELEPYLGLLRPYGAMVLVGAPPQPASVGAFSLINNNRRLAGSSIGNIQETQEMLDFCAQHRLGATVEVIAARQVNEAYERMLKSDVRYRFVIDASTIKA